jgi:hypothetical protein
MPDTIDVDVQIALEPDKRMAVTVIGDPDTLFGCFSAEVLEQMGPLVGGAIEKVEG